MSSLLFSSLKNDVVPAFAAATHQARQMFSRNGSRNSTSSRRSSTEQSEIESTHPIFDEFGAFEQAHGEPPTDVSAADYTDDDEELEEEADRLSEQMQRGAIPTQKNSPGLRGAAKARSTVNWQLGKQQAPCANAERSIKVGVKDEATESDNTLHARAATDPLSSAALSRMRYYRKLIPAPKPSNTSPKSEPRPENHLSNAQHTDNNNRRFFPPSQSAAAILYHSNRSLPIAIPLKRLSPTNDDSHRFRADLHPRVAADSSFILPAASYLPSALQKSFVPLGESDQQTARKHSLSFNNRADSAVREDYNDSPFGFQFEMDM